MIVKKLFSNYRDLTKQSIFMYYESEMFLKKYSVRIPIISTLRKCFCKMNKVDIMDFYFVTVE